MNVRHKIFLLLSLVLLSTIVIYIWVYSGVYKQQFMDELETSSREAEISFKSDLDSTATQMLQIATIIAHDQKVQQLFLLGKQALALEGGGAGGELTAQVRTSLFDHLQQSQSILREQFGFRQLHFHFGPGSLSFLRVHRPEKFGDRMDNVRHTIVAANAEQKNTTGFETGRVVSGIRGVTPVYALDGVTKKEVHVGALEAGTSFTNMLSLFKKNRPGLNAAVLLSHEHLKANVWPEFLEDLITENTLINDFYIEATTSTDINDYLATAEGLLSPGQKLLQHGDNWSYFTSFPLRDFRGENDPQTPDAGIIVLWKDVSTQLAVYHELILSLIFYGWLLFLAIEILMYFALSLVTAQLQEELQKTQQQEMESEHGRLLAEESSRLKTEFLGNMSHELRTPMNAIMGMGQLLDETSLDQQQQNYINKINLSSKRLLTLIDEILLTSDMDPQVEMSLPAESFNPEQLLQRIKNNFVPHAKSNGVTFTVVPANNLPSKVDGFPAQIESVLNQLTGNAIKFNSGGHVTLSLSLPKQTDKSITLEFSVSDDGIGIAAEKQEHIFLPFYQGDGSTTRKYGGTGLGLTIAQKVCRQLGSELKLESALGQGSCFSFCLTFNNSAELADAVPALPTVSPEEESAVALPAGTMTELLGILCQLEDPLSKLQALPSQKIALFLKDKCWPKNQRESIEQLRHLIEQYRFLEAQAVVLQLKKNLV